MRKSMLVAGVATMAAMFALPSALQAHDSSNRRDGGSQMPGSGMMGQMSQMMDHCSQMMQGSSTRPNEQWRDGTPPAGGQNGKKQ